MKLLSILLTPLAVCLVGSGLVHAGTNNFVVPQFRGSQDSEAGYWETFSVAYGAPLYPTPPHE